MPFISIIFGGLLIGLGLWGYLTSGRESVTALIPAFVGAPLVLAGLVAMVERFLKHAMHAAAMIGLIGGIAAAIKFVQGLIRGHDLEHKPTFSSAVMTLLCSVFIAFCINSFIQARRRRRAAAQAQTQRQW